LGREKATPDSTDSFHAAQAKLAENPQINPTQPPHPLDCFVALLFAMNGFHCVPHAAVTR